MSRSEMGTKLNGLVMDWLISDIQSCFKDMMKSESFWMDINEKIPGYDEEYILEILDNCRVELRMSNSSKYDYL